MIEIEEKEEGTAVLERETVGECGYCERPLVRKRTNGRFSGRFPTYCNSRCRVRHWRENQKEKEAT